MRLRHIGITVRDMDRSLYFYKDLLGLVVAKDAHEFGEHIDNFSNLENVNVRTVKLQDVNGMMIELLEYCSPVDNTIDDNFDKPINRVGISHFALTVDDVDGVCKRLTSSGVSFNYAVQNSPDDYAKLTFCSDFEGNLIELVEVM